MRPTDRQVAALRDLPDDELLDKALASLHALNRRAKEKRDRCNKYWRATFADAVTAEIDEIYELKSRFLAALVEAELASVATFQNETWDLIRRDDGIGDEHAFVETWHIVSCRGYAFHVPPLSATDTMRKVATPGDPHDPFQPQREIPDVGLTIEAQQQCVELAIDRLRASASSRRVATRGQRPASPRRSPSPRARPRPKKEDDRECNQQ